MHAALEQAKQAQRMDEIPVGAVVVRKGEIIGEGFNRTIAENNPTAHAEIVAIEAACNNIGSRLLTGCDLYVTLEPCVMCTGALLFARISTLYFGAFEPKFGACGSVYNIAEKSNYNHKLKVYSGILEDESSSILKEYFASKRVMHNFY